MTPDATDLPGLRGKLLAGAELAPYTWFRVGGPADALVLPADEQDLADLMRALPGDVPVTVLGVGSNVIVRDGGIEGVTVRLAGGHWGAIERDGRRLRVRAGALDLAVAKRAAREGLTGLEFLSGIPGSMGGAVRTNAGCYGRELKDVFVSLTAIDRAGETVTLGPDALDFSYRHSALPGDVIVTSLELEASGEGDPDDIAAHISDLQARRAETQPIREKTSGSTFANPDPPGTPDQRKAWQLIDAAGCRGLEVGGARVSEKHCNFLINTGEARAADLEALGELVRTHVRETSGVDLRWEVRRLGRLKRD
ncbi:UDP-N-acetylenolpyruvoylglucosamine reductase [Phormidium willei BDU 130791]|nr:UDP-N-acetylenolpyruvoylglucosamine reductase [Phormidium willei BDU 130791]